MNPRFRAFLIHLTGSVLLGLLVVALVFLIWYPTPLHHATGVTAIFFIVVGVDVVIGPVLTLIVFKPGKKTLRFDLTTIVILQLIAFGYGIWVVAEGRPVWLVFNVDRFDLIQAYKVDSRHLDEARPEYRSIPWFGPRWVSAHAPADLDKRNTLTFESVFGGVDLPQRPDLYQSLTVETDTIRQKAQPLNQLSRYNPPEAVRAEIARWPEADAWLPMMAPAKSVTVLLRKDQAKVVAVVNLNPWD